MGALIGREITQTRIWIDPSQPDLPNLNYKEVFPITVFDAIREEIKEDSPSLRDTINRIFEELRGKQPIFPSIPGNYLMTFAGVAGEVGSIEIACDIPWNPKDQSHRRIPTEKAVGQLLLNLGYNVGPDGEIINEPEKTIRWSDIIGRPNIYDELGSNDNGVISQKVITNEINKINTTASALATSTDSNFTTINERLDTHFNDMDNPHNVSLSQLNAVSQDAFEFHIDNVENPHSVTKEQVGLGNVNNTSDINKPISTAVQAAIDIITGNVSSFIFVTGATFDAPTGILSLNLNNSTSIGMYIPTPELYAGSEYDGVNKSIIFYKHDGSKEVISLKDLFIRYIGSVGHQITVVIDGDQVTGYQTIQAILNPESVSAVHLGDESVVTRTLGYQAVTTDKIADGNITSIKLATAAVTTGKIADRSVDSDKLFTSGVSNRVLAVIDAGGDPIYTQVNDGMISYNAVKSAHIENQNVTTVKLADAAVTTPKISDLSITRDKIADSAIINSKILHSSIEGNRLVEDIVLPGTPKILVRPESDAYNNQVPDTRWVKDVLKDYEFSNSNYSDRSVDGRVLFSSPNSDKVLIVGGSESDPKWGMVNDRMIEDNSIKTSHIQNNAVTKDKINNLSIESRHITNKSIKTEHISDGAVGTLQLFPSDTPNRVLAACDTDLYPIYTQVSREMIADAAVTTRHLEDQSVALRKLAPADQHHRLLGSVIRNTAPQWLQATNGMLGDRVVDGRTLFSASNTNRVLVVTDIASDPQWLQVNGEMLLSNIIRRHHITDGAIWSEHLQEKIIDSQHIVDKAVQSHHLTDRLITGKELFTSPVSNRVLAVTEVPYSDPQWIQVTTDMIKDSAVTGDKIFKSFEEGCRVLGVTRAEAPPEYTMITNDFIVNDTIRPEKLIRNFLLLGTPKSEESPNPEADNNQLADTYWVQRRLFDLHNVINNDIDTLTGVVGEMRNEVDGFNFLNDMTYDQPSGHLTSYWRHGQTKVLEIPISKLLQEIQFTPSIYSLTAERLNGQTFTVDLSHTHDVNHIINGRFNFDKLPTSGNSNRILAALNLDESPVYTKLINPMIDDRVVDGRTLFTTHESNRVLTVTTGNDNPSWTQVNGNMIVDNVALAGNPTTTTQEVTDNSKKLATTEFVKQSISLYNNTSEIYRIGAIDTNVVSGLMGYTVPGNKAVIMIPFKAVKASIPTATLAGTFRVRVPDGTLINVSSWSIIGITTSCATVEFTLSSVYATNTPCMLVYGDNNTTITIS